MQSGDTRQDRRFVALLWLSEVRENDLYADIIGGMLREGCRVFRIADGSAGKKPFDVAGVAPGGAGVGVEVKAPSRAEAVGLDWALFERHQVQWLRAYAHHGAVSLAAVYDRQARRLLVWRLTDAGDTCCRPPDASLAREGGFFVGWAALCAAGKGPSEQGNG
jgi:hypothetical protein